MGVGLGGSLLFLMTKYYFFLSKTYLYFFTARGSMEFSYRIRSLFILVITYISIFLLHRYLFPNWWNTKSGVKWFYYRSLHCVLYWHHMIECCGLCCWPQHTVRAASDREESYCDHTSIVAWPSQQTVRVMIRLRVSSLNKNKIQFRHLL